MTLTAEPGAVVAEPQPRREPLTRIPMYKLGLLSGRANPLLSQEIADCLNVDLISAKIVNFPDGEIKVELLETVRDTDVYIIQPTSPSPNDAIQELCFLIDAASRAGAREITVVLPYSAYARQDRKKDGREPISSAVVAKAICGAGNVRRIVSLDLHNAALQGTFPVTTGDHFFATDPLCSHIRKYWMDGDPVIVSPDIGGTSRASAFAHELNLDTAIIDKYRSKTGATKSKRIIGDVKGRIAIMVDDIIDTAGTVTDGAKLLIREGAKKVYVVATNGLFSGPAMERIIGSPICELAVTNSVAIPTHKQLSNLSVVSVAPLLGEAIRRIFMGEEVSDMIGWLRAGV